MLPCTPLVLVVCALPFFAGVIGALYFRMYPGGIMKRTPKLTRSMHLFNHIAMATPDVMPALDAAIGRSSRSPCLPTLITIRELLVFYVPLVALVP